MRRHFEPSTDSELETLNPAAHGLNVGVPFLQRDYAEVNIDIGAPVLGLDGTYRFDRGVTLTAAAGWGRGQLVVQRAVLDRHHVGVSLGVFGRLDRIRVDTEQGYFDLGLPEKTAYLHSFGERLVGRGIWASDVLQGIVSVGYAPQLDAPVARIGLVIYGFKEGGIYRDSSVPSQRSNQ